MGKVMENINMKNLLRYGAYSAIVSALVALPGFQNPTLDIARITVQAIAELFIFFVFFQFSKKRRLDLMRRVCLGLFVIIPLNFVTEVLSRHFVPVMDAIPFALVMLVILLQGAAYIVFGVSLSKLKELYPRLVATLQVFFIIQGVLFITILLDFLLPLVQLTIGILLAILLFTLKEN